METTMTTWVKQVTITETDYLSPYLKKIRFAGDFSKAKFEPGQAIIFRVNATEHRNYTPCFFDSEKGICDVLFYLNGIGPGSSYIDALKPGHTLYMALPRGFNLLKKESKFHFFYGDETTLGLFYSFKQVMEKRGEAYAGIMDLTMAREIPACLNLNLKTVSSTLPHGRNAVEYLNSVDSHTWNQWATGTFYLMGNARSIQTFRKALKEKGIAGSNIVTQPYWVEGKKGL